MPWDAAAPGRATTAQLTYARRTRKHPRTTATQDLVEDNESDHDDRDEEDQEEQLDSAAKMEYEASGFLGTRQALHGLTLDDDLLH